MRHFCLDYPEACHAAAFIGLCIASVFVAVAFGTACEFVQRRLQARHAEEKRLGNLIDELERQTNPEKYK